MDTYTATRLAVGLEGNRVHITAYDNDDCLITELRLPVAEAARFAQRILISLTGVSN